MRRYSITFVFLLSILYNVNDPATQPLPHTSYRRCNFKLAPWFYINITSSECCALVLQAAADRYFAELVFSISFLQWKNSSFISQQALRLIPITDSLASKPLNLFHSGFLTTATNENEWMPCSAAKMETGGWCLRAGVSSAASECERLVSIPLCLKYFTRFWCLAALTETDAFGQQVFCLLLLHQNDSVPHWWNANKDQQSALS